MNVLPGILGSWKACVLGIPGKVCFLVSGADTKDWGQTEGGSVFLQNLLSPLGMGTE